MAAIGVVIASIAFNFDVLKLKLGPFLACGLAIWFSLVTLQAFKHPQWFVYKQQKDYVTISSFSFQCRQNVYVKYNMYLYVFVPVGDNISVVYKKFLFW